MNINFNQIKALKLSLFQNNENLDSFLNDLFSFNNIDKKLIYLNLNLAEYKINMNSKLFENINKLKLLQYLTLFNFIFDDFELKLNNLKYIYLNKCKNIKFKENIFLKLKYLNLNYSTIINNSNSNSLLKCPNVESCELFSYMMESTDYNLIFDFASFNNLKYFKGKSRYFTLLENTLLEKVFLDLDYYKIMDKLLLIKTIKDIEIDIMSHSLKYISEYENKNYSIKKLKLNIINTISSEDEYKCLIDIQEKFPNLSEFILNTKNSYSKKYD